MPSTARGASPGRQSTTAFSSSSSSMPLPGPSGGGGSVGGVDGGDDDDTAASETGGVRHEGVQSGSTTPSRRPTLRSAASSSLSSTQATLSEPSAPSPPPSSTPSPRPRFLSRFSLPLRNRNRHVADFHIRPDEPHRKYSAGGGVRGAVVLAVVKPLRITHLTVSLHGFVRVFRDPTASAKRKAAISLPQGSSDRPQYHGHGLATLFQDEQVLSGEGRLDPGNYEFHFDLLFPKTGLPSSIDFERGTISYLITATLTRPTSIAPTATCDRKVRLEEQVDIGSLPPPRPRTIFLEPISKRSKKKKSMVLEKAVPAPSDVATDLASEAESADLSVAAEDSSRDRLGDSRSEMSGESSRSVSTAISRAEFAQLSQMGTALSSPVKQQVVADKTITASIELLRGGCLPGDTVTARIRVQHIKRLKSMTGVVVTLFRQGKIDSSPPASLFKEMTAAQRERRAQKEDVYPRSRAGLAGLSLSSASSTSMFRKDLDQNTAPLIVDPDTLQASVTISVKLPDDTFPTIKGVPGEMISFKYQLEVIVDLGGKLAGQFPGGLSRYGSGGADSSNYIYGPKREAIIADTAPLRREKGVICVSMEAVVGTTDSSRSRKRQTSPSRSRKKLENDEEDFINPELGYLDDSQDVPSRSSGNTPNGYHQPHPPYSDQQYGGPPSGPSPHQQWQYQAPPVSPPRPDYTQANGHRAEAAPTYVPRPQIPDQSSMTEKERVRQAEMRLLPSQPPPTAGPSTAQAEDDNLYEAYEADETPRGPVPADPAEGPSAPTQDDMAEVTSTEDKQELERRRLMGEASVPPEFPEDMQHRRANGGEPSGQQTPPDAEPSAPVLDDDDDGDGDGDDEENSYHGYGVGAGPSRVQSSRGGNNDSSNSNNRDAEQLPAYER